MEGSDDEEDGGSEEGVLESAFKPVALPISSMTSLPFLLFVLFAISFCRLVSLFDGLPND